MEALAQARPGRVEDLMFKALKEQQALIVSLRDEVVALKEQDAQLQLWRGTAQRQIDDMREELAGFRAALPAASGGGRPADIQAPPAVRHAGSLPLVAAAGTTGDVQSRGANDPGTPRPPSQSPVPTSGSTSPFETSHPTVSISTSAGSTSAATARETSSPTATMGASSPAGPSTEGGSGALSRSDGAIGARLPPADDMAQQHMDAARQRHEELRAASSRQQQHGNVVMDFGTDAPRRGGRGGPRGFQPTERRGPVLPRSLVPAGTSGGGAPTAPTTRQPLVATEPQAIATGATIGSAAPSAVGTSTASPTAAASATSAMSVSSAGGATWTAGAVAAMGTATSAAGASAASAAAAATAGSTSGAAEATSAPPHMAPSV
eukprot:7360089-Prymnesium_polylepis.3